MHATFPVASIFRYVAITWLVYKQRSVSEFLVTSATMATLQRRLWRVPMLLSRNGLQCQQFSLLVEVRAQLSCSKMRSSAPS
uniref:Uncharacterized protein n=1 Tax=Hyaloperonospora arabidopsidis (strain Emoy2) TaxID=559515 RepID=M4BMH4_HYAAE